MLPTKTRSQNRQGFGPRHQITKQKPGGNSAEKTRRRQQKKKPFISSENYGYFWRLAAQVNSGPLLA